jgi:hypothetical protein
MSKYITIYQPNSLGEIEKIEMIDGVVVQEEWEYPRNGWDNVWSFFYSHGATVGGNEWEARYKREPYNDNGREYNSASGNWEYTASASGEANPFQCNYEAPQDYQGSVPVWDGYNGE